MTACACGSESVWRVSSSLIIHPSVSHERVPQGKMGPKAPLADVVTILEPKEEEVPVETLPTV